MAHSSVAQNLDYSAAQGAEIVVVQGRRMSEKQAVKLEQSLHNSPDDLRSRLLLLGHYWARQNRDRSLANAIGRHLLWLMENAPDSGVLEYPFFYSDCGAFRKVKRRWSEAVKDHPDDIVYLRRAASSCSLVDPRASLSYLKRAQKLNPENEDWPQQISHLYIHSASSSGGAMPRDMQSVRQALKAGRQALQLHKKFPRPSYLEKNMQLTVSRLADTALQCGLFDEALYFGKYLIERCEQVDDHGEHGSEPVRKRRSEGHMGHSICGRLALHQGKVEIARMHLAFMAQLADPEWQHDLLLAGALLRANEKEVVLIYLKRCAMDLKELLIELETSAVRRHGQPAPLMMPPGRPGKNLDTIKSIKAQTTKKLIRINEWSTAIRSERKPKLPDYI